MLVFPGFNKVAFQIGPLKVHWYGIMYLLGFAGAWWLARRRAAKPGSTWKKADVDDLIFFAMLGVIFGGRIGYILFYGLSFWASDPWYPLKLWEGGMSFHGGLLGVPAVDEDEAQRGGPQAGHVDGPADDDDHVLLQAGGGQGGPEAGQGVQAAGGRVQ